MFFDGDVAADDQKASFGPADGTVHVVVDSQSAQLLEGATLDYKDGLNQAGFAITNPNATRTCGCGNSFSRATAAALLPRQKPSLARRSRSSLLSHTPSRRSTTTPLLSVK